MEQARVNIELKKVVEDLKPGSGKIWKNQLTKPSVPKITGTKQPKSNGDLDTIYNRPKQKIKSLERPITPAYSAHNMPKKRHNVYHTQNELQIKLKNSDNMLKHYMNSVERKEASILDELGSGRIY